MPKNVEEIQNKIIGEFAECADWKERFEMILEIGAEFQADHKLSDEHKIDENLVPGCVSRVWLVSDFKDGKVIYEAESEALIVQGLAALAIEVFSEQTPETIIKTPADYLEKTGLIHNLTPSRSNGVASLVKTIKEHAAKYL